MIKLKKLNLRILEREHLSDNHMRCILGGSSSNCTCGCHYADAGGSSTGNNDVANQGYGYTSYGGQESCGCSGSNGVRVSEFWANR